MRSPRRAVYFLSPRIRHCECAFPRTPSPKYLAIGNGVYLLTVRRLGLSCWDIMPEHLGNSNKLQMASAHAMTLITWPMVLPGKFQAWIEGFQAAPLQVRLRSMRWAALPTAVLLASIHQAAVYLLSGESIPDRSLILSLLLYSLVGADLDRHDAGRRIGAAQR